MDGGYVPSLADEIQKRAQELADHVAEQATHGMTEVSVAMPVGADVKRLTLPATVKVVDGHFIAQPDHAEIRRRQKAAKEAAL